jgi:hypothetical protein
MTTRFFAGFVLLAFAFYGHAQTNVARSGRFIRGSGNDPAYHSFVVPLEFQKGIALDLIGGNVTNFYAPNPFNFTFYHYNATNPASSTNNAFRIPYRNPIVAFGNRVGGTPLYIGQPYDFGIYAGDPAPYFRHRYLCRGLLSVEFRIR